MVDDPEIEDGTDIRVGPPEVEIGSVGGSATSAEEGPAPGRKTDLPARTYRRVLRRYRRLPKRDKFAVLLAVLAVVLVIVLMSIWSTGGGFGDGYTPPEVRPVSDWNMEALTEVQMTGQGENTNLEGQQTPYLVTLKPNATEIFFVTHLRGHVTWTDESTPPSNFPAIGYSNEPDGFQLIIEVHDNIGDWQSEVVFNSQGGSGDIDFPEDMTLELGAPIAVASREGARYLPQGYVESIRVDFIVRTDECGDWTTNDFRPPIGDAGNHFVFDWELIYKQADSAKSP